MFLVLVISIDRIIWPNYKLHKTVFWQVLVMKVTVLFS